MHWKFYKFQTCQRWWLTIVVWHSDRLHKTLFNSISKTIDVPWDDFERLIKLSEKYNHIFKVYFVKLTPSFPHIPGLKNKRYKIRSVNFRRVKVLKKDIITRSATIGPMKLIKINRGKSKTREWVFKSRNNTPRTKPPRQGSEFGCHCYFNWVDFLPFLDETVLRPKIRTHRCQAITVKENDVFNIVLMLYTFRVKFQNLQLPWTAEWKRLYWLLFRNSIGSSYTCSVK